MEKRKYIITLRSEEGVVLNQVDYEGVTYPPITVSEWIGSLLPGQTIEVKLEKEED